MRNLIGIGRSAILERRVQHEDHRRLGDEFEMVPWREARPQDADEIGLLETDQPALPDDQPGPFAEKCELRELRPDIGDVLDALQSDPPSPEPKFVLRGAENDFEPAFAVRPMPKAPKAMAPEPRCWRSLLPAALPA